MRRRDFLRTSAVLGAATAALPDDALGWALARDARARANVSAQRLDDEWAFIPGDPVDAASPGSVPIGWEVATLPHTPRIEALVTGAKDSPTGQWQGTCWYRRWLRVPAEAAGKKVFLKFEAAMNVADVYLDGEHLGTHLGGFLPFVYDISDRVRAGGEGSLLAVRLDNRDNPITGPKPLEILDFNTYGGLYRNVWLITKDRLHITDPIHADREAAGGVFVTFPEVSSERAVLRVRTTVRNDHNGARRFWIHHELRGARGGVSSAQRPNIDIAAHETIDIELDLHVSMPSLWSPRAPNLYTLHSEIRVGSEIVDGMMQATSTVDAVDTRVGIRRISITPERGFEINGEPMFLRGTNRHQEYPYVGYAVPDAAQWRDAQKIKQAGFDYIRLSHYPQSPAFMDACDELGLVVMNAIPGWQYFGLDPAFAEYQYRNVRELIRRDRNHPCVVLWEVSLNETAMPPEFVERTHRIAHEEYPDDQMYTCGWVPGYDVYIRARQHGGCHELEPGGVPCLVSEYGDWEYYAMTAGLDQESFAALTPGEQNSRQLRWHGERALLQQATNFQEAHDDNRSTVAFADGLWVMYDYNRGYAPDIESSGCADIFRLPKYSYYFFASQRDASEGIRPTGIEGGFMRREAPGAFVFIASEWNAQSTPLVRVFSNCDEVELVVNRRSLGRQLPDRDRISRHLAHAPFTFDVGAFEPGELLAFGYRAGARVAEQVLRTPGSIVGLRAWIDHAGRMPVLEEKDVLIAHAAFVDRHGTTVPDAWENVHFGLDHGSLVGANPFSSDAGIASILIEKRPDEPAGTLYALALIGGRPLGAAARVGGGEPPPFELRRVAGGAELVVDRRPLVRLSEGEPKFRIQGSTPPETLEPFRRD